MVDITETVTFNQLREAASQEVSLSTIIPVDISGETVRIFLSQILALLDENAITPFGVFLPFIGTEDQIPDGWDICKGQPFDPVVYPELGKIIPSGIIPDMRGIAAVGAKDGEAISSYEADALKIHGHTASTGSNSHSHTRGSMNITGTFNQGDYDQQIMNQWKSLTNAFYVTGQGSSARSNQSTSNRTTMATGAAFQASRNWTGSTSSYSHSHTVSIANAGDNSENRIKNRKFNWIVRLQ